MSVDDTCSVDFSEEQVNRLRQEVQSLHNLNHTLIQVSTTLIILNTLYQQLFLDYTFT